MLCLTLTAVAITCTTPPVPSAESRAPSTEIRIGIVKGTLGSFASTILTSHQTAFELITPKVPGDSLANYGLIVIDNLYRLQDINGAAFKTYVENGGVLMVLNPKADGFSRTWAPYDIFIGEYTIEARINNRKHPLFTGFTDDKIADLADSNGPFVGNCSFAEPGKEWTILARHAKKKKNAVILEAGFGKGHLILACTRFDNYNARPTATRLGDNLLNYAVGLAKARP
jgi:hypothetical protein